MGAAHRPEDTMRLGAPLATTGRRQPLRGAGGLWRGLAAIALLGATTTLLGQSNPTLTRQQRSALQSLVAAVDRMAGEAETAEIEWPIHLLRASDGSHYVAFSIMNPPDLQAGQPVVAYIRLATRRDPRVAGIAERSVIADWLAGQGAPPPRRERALAFGDMPIFGAASAASAGRDPGASTRGVAPQTLQLLEMERERARERREAAERERKAALEGTGQTGTRGVLPFEDFDLRATAIADASGMPMLRRSLTAGPGEYDLIVGWLDPAARDAAASIRVVKRPVSLPIASTKEFALSSVIVADRVDVREMPPTAEQQSANPYSIGATEIAPARDSVLTNDERLSLIFQVINAQPSIDGKPDVVVGFRVFRVTPVGQESIGVLNPQMYNADTLPAEFDLRKGHPVFAAVGVPLASFKRGDYRIQITADDRFGGVSAMGDTSFTVVATPMALLREAPPLAGAFRREHVLTSAILDALAASLQPRSPSSALTTAFEAVRAGRFVELVRDDAVSTDEAAVRATLRGLALFALGDTPAAVSLPLRQAMDQLSSPGPAHLLIGASRAIEGNDREAAAAWRTAATTGLDERFLASLLVDAYLRAGDTAAAAMLADRFRESTEPSLTRRVAAAYIAAGREPDALAVLDAHLARATSDDQAQWLRLRALFSGIVQRRIADTARFLELAAAYVGANGRHAALAKDWSAIVTTK
jgi:hypothetical protein